MAPAVAEQLKPLDIDGARARLRDARGRVDRLPNHVLRGALPPGTTALLLDVLADLGRALDHIVALERAMLGQDAYVAELGQAARDAYRTFEALPPCPPPDADTATLGESADAGQEHGGYMLHLGALVGLGPLASTGKDGGAGA